MEPAHLPATDTTPDQTRGSRLRTGALRFLPAMGVVLATSVTAAACSATGGSPPPAQSTRQVVADAASASATPADAATTALARSPSMSTGG